MVGNEPESVDVVDVDISFEWEPPWDPDMMSNEARRQLNEGDR